MGLARNHDGGEDRGRHRMQEHVISLGVGDRFEDASDDEAAITAPAHGAP